MTWDCETGRDWSVRLLKSRTGVFGRVRVSDWEGRLDPPNTSRAGQGTMTRGPRHEFSRAHFHWYLIYTCVFAESVA